MELPEDYFTMDETFFRVNSETMERVQNALYRLYGIPPLTIANKPYQVSCNLTQKQANDNTKT